MEKIRHGIKPEITYTFIPDALQDNAPDFLARIPAQNSLTYALTNTLLSRIREKDGRVAYREMMRLKLAQTYDIREARRDTAEPGTGSRPFGDVTIWNWTCRLFSISPCRRETSTASIPATGSRPTMI